MIFAGPCILAMISEHLPTLANIADEDYYTDSPLGRSQIIERIIHLRRSICHAWYLSNATLITITITESSSPQQIHSKSLIRQVSLSHSSKINIENHFSYASFPGSYQHLILFIPRCILLLSSRTILCPPDIALGLPLRRHSTLRYSQRMAIIGSISRYSQHSSSSQLSFSHSTR